MSLIPVIIYGKDHTISYIRNYHFKLPHNTFYDSKGITKKYYAQHMNRIRNYSKPLPQYNFDEQNFCVAATSCGYHTSYVGRNACVSDSRKTQIKLIHLFPQKTLLLNPHIENNHTATTKTHNHQGEKKNGVHTRNSVTITDHRLGNNIPIILSR